MNIFFKIGKILFQILAAILILIALVLEYLSKPRKSKSHNKQIGKDNDKKIKPNKIMTKSLSHFIYLFHINNPHHSNLFK